MGYCEKFRQKVMNYLDKGHTQREARATFEISMATINKWRKMQRETGNLKDPVAKNRRSKKIEPEKLKAYVQAHPDAYQKEIAQEFSCSDTAIRKALKRLNITRKKRPNSIKNKTQSR